MEGPPDDKIFAAAYPGCGRDSYHPKMLTKVIVYAYTQRIYSSRQIAKAIRENVMFMWIAGRQRPDYRIINRFSSERMKAEQMQTYTFVWGKAVVKHKMKLKEKVQTFFATIEEAEKQENPKYTKKSLLWGWLVGTSIYQKGDF
jgi:hypothetical protein